MRTLDSIEDQMRDVVTVEFHDGTLIRLSAKHVRMDGLANVLRQAGLGDKLPTKKLPVFHCGEMVGMMHPDFDPCRVETKTLLMYDPRHGDFVRDGDRWIAHKSLGPGDIAAVPHFTPARPRT